MKRKGGLWSNAEDEVLKTLVIKYGKNQWRRSSTLVGGKSDKHAKARWCEWLDPSIIKTDWTKQEDEKLLHLAKLMPSQWRTIAPIVRGRTPSQCLERYEKLLDAACENYDDDDTRKLRPGEIDPNPESKPARPDHVDMDEDEIQMLSEARARLANTRGKKAKRKAREKQFQEARRLASLQKRRELKAAGFDNRKRKREGGIDYNAEIPFEKKPPPGFYDVMDEIQLVEEQPKFPTTIEELEGEQRSDKEDRLRKQDAARNMILQRRQDAPSAILQANKLNDLEAFRKRPKLNLPTPQIPDRELEHIAKFRLPALGEELAQGSGVTRALLADTPGRGTTSLRTPQRTPLRDGPSIGMTPKGTPIRDELQINTHMDMSDKLELRRQAGLRGNLRSGLTSLPQPKNEYQILVLPISEENEEPEETMEEEDMSDTMAREKDEVEAKLQALQKRRSQVLQRELPRPPAASLKLLKNSLNRADEGKNSFVTPTLIEQADEMVRKETVTLLEHDNLKYPTDENVQEKEVTKRTAKGISASVPLIDQFEEDELKDADIYMMKECMAMGHESEYFDKFVEAHRTCLNDIMYFPTRSSYGLSSAAGNMEKVTALRDEFENVRRRIDDDAKKAQKFEHKIRLLTNGYQHRGRNLWSQIEATLKLLDDAGTELKCFQALQDQEQLATLHRFNALWEEVQKQKELEQTLQERYGHVLSAQARIQEENAAKKCALELAEAGEMQHDLCVGCGRGETLCS